MINDYILQYLKLYGVIYDYIRFGLKCGRYAKP